MAWTLYKDKLLEIVQARLQDRQYCNSEHLLLDKPFIVAMLRHFPDPDAVLAEYEEDGKIECAFIISLGKNKAGCFVSKVSQISAAYICNSVEPAKLQFMLKSLFSVLPKSILVFMIGYQDSDILNPKLFEQVKNCLVDPYASNTSIPAGVDFEKYWSERSKSTRKGIKRASGKLDRDGIAVTYNVVNTRSELAEGLRKYGELESAGWKGREGSAIDFNNQQGAFYADVLGAYVDQGQAKVHQLRFDNTVVASLLTIEDERMNIALKTTYDEAFAKYAPGRLLDYYMLQELLSGSSSKNIENFTSASVEDQKWWPRVRQMYHVTIYRYRWLIWLRDLKVLIQRRSNAA